MAARALMVKRSLAAPPLTSESAVPGFAHAWTGILGNASVPSSRAHETVIRPPTMTATAFQTTLSTTSAPASSARRDHAIPIPRMGSGHAERVSNVVFPDLITPLAPSEAFALERLARRLPTHAPSGETTTIVTMLPTINVIASRQWATRTAAMMRIMRGATLQGNASPASRIPTARSSREGEVCVGQERASHLWCCNQKHSARVGRSR